MPGVLPLATGAGHMLYRLIALLHSLLVTLFQRQQSNQNNPIRRMYAILKEDKRVVEISRFYPVPHSLSIKRKLVEENGSNSINLITRKTGH